MNPPSQSEDALFVAALNCATAAEREVFLQRACAGQPTLRQRVEALLAAHDRAGDFLETKLMVSPDRPGARQTPRPVEPQVGERILRYKILQKLGEGGCGVVYVAEQEEPVRRRVALKVIKPGMDTKQVIARFEAERQALAMMDHANIARVFDAGTTEAGRPFFVMELVRGIKITDYCDQARLSTDERLKLFAQVCRAIQHAHQKGIIHRDIKPSNILVTLHDGVPVPKVIDFGIAKATEGRLTEHTVFTQLHHLIGTPAYMSPEQAELSGLDIDTRSDIYSLGVLLYELLTGSTPFDARELIESGLDAMRQTIRLQEPPRPSTRLSRLTVPALTLTASRQQTDAPKLIHRISGDLDWIVMKCLEKDRRRRYETANGLAMDLMRHLDNEPVLARPPSVAYRFQKTVRRHRLAFLSATAVGAAIVLALAALAYTTLHVTQERNQKDIALQERSAAMELATQRAGEVRNQLFQALRDQARAARYSRRPGQRLDSLAALTQAAQIRPDENLRDDAIAAMALPDIRPGPSSERWVPDTKIFSFDDLYRRYARFETDGTIRVHATADDQELQRIASSPVTAGWCLRLSPNGEFIAKLEAQDRLRVWRVADGQAVLRELPEGCGGLAFSHDGRQLVIGQTNWIRRFDLRTGLEVNRWAIPTSTHRLAFAPDDRWLAVGYNQSEVTSIYAVADGRLVADLPVGSMESQILAWHPDGEHLAIAGDQPNIQIWDVPAQRQTAKLVGHVQQVTELTFHPQGGLLASHSWDGVLRLWEPWSGRELLQVPSQAWIRFSGDGQWLGLVWAGDRRYQLLEIAPSLEYHSLSFGSVTEQVGLYEGDLSGDGRWLASSTQCDVQIRDLPSGRLVARLPTGPSNCALFEPNGQALLTCGPSNVQRWAIKEVGHGQLQIGPPKNITLPFAKPTRIRLSDDGQDLWVVSEAAGSAGVVNLASNLSPQSRFEHTAAGFLALSRDGHWLATAGWHSPWVRLWDTQAGTLLHEWEGPRQSSVFFTPDSRELVICRGDEFSFWNVETSQLSRRLPREVALFGGYVAFSPDGSLMALPLAPGIVEIKEVATTHTVARLEDPFGDRANWMAFTPGNHELVVHAGYNQALHVWDLDAIRKRLTPMNLSRDWPGFRQLTASPLRDRAQRRPAMRIEVVSAESPTGETEPRPTVTAPR